MRRRVELFKSFAEIDKRATAQAYIIFIARDRGIVNKTIVDIRNFRIKYPTTLGGLS